MDKNHVELYTDGSALGNPGPSGYGFVIRYWFIDDDDQPTIGEFEQSQGFRLSTNNRMEVMAALIGIDRIIAGVIAKAFKDVNQINLTTDSKYLYDAISKGWVFKWEKTGWIGSDKKTVKNVDLWETFIDIQKTLRRLNISLQMNHILGHKGHEFNERADKLCTAASRDKGNHMIDQVYENWISTKKEEFWRYR